MAGQADEEVLQERLAVIVKIDPDVMAPPERLLRSRYLAETNRSLASLSERLDRLASALESMPAAARLLPLPLGNRLRAFEDRASNVIASAPVACDTIEDYVPCVYDELEPALRYRLDHAKGRLEGYCSLALCFVLLAAMSLASIGLHGVGLSLAGALIVASAVAHFAAVSTATEYGLVVEKIASAAAVEPGLPPSPSVLTLTEEEFDVRLALIFD